MSEHRELLEVLLSADDAHKPEGAMWPELATAILAAGYRRQPEPREVTTVECKVPGDGWRPCDVNECANPRRARAWVMLSPVTPSTEETP